MRVNLTCVFADRVNSLIKKERKKALSTASCTEKLSSPNEVSGSAQFQMMVLTCSAQAKISLTTYVQLLQWSRGKQQQQTRLILAFGSVCFRKVCCLTFTLPCTLQVIGYILTSSLDQYYFRDADPVLAKKTRRLCTSKVDF